MRIDLWIAALATVQNGWTFTAFMILLAVWLRQRR